MIILEIDGTIVFGRNLDDARGKGLLAPRHLDGFINKYKMEVGL